MSHSIVLSNTLCRDEYPGNQGCEFTNQLNIPLDVSHGKWAVNLSEIIYEPYFWANIRKPYTYFDVGVSNFHYQKIAEDYVLFKDIYVTLKKEITNLNDPVELRVTLELLTKDS